MRSKNLAYFLILWAILVLTSCGTYEASSGDPPKEENFTSVTFSLSLEDNPSLSPSPSGDNSVSSPLPSEDNSSSSPLPSGERDRVRGTSRALYKINCASTSIANIVITVYNSSNTELMKKTFACSAGSGTITVQSGNNHRFVFSGKNASGQELYRGERSGINLQPGTIYNMGEITMTRVIAMVEVTPASATIIVGGIQQFTAVARDTNENIISGVTFTWDSSNTSVATVDSTGKVTAVGEGTATIRATSGDKSGTATVAVSTIQTVEVTPTSTTIAVSGTQWFTARAKDANGNIITGVTFTWSSSNTSVVTVDSSGKITAVGEGTATITATSGDKSGTATVTVTLIPSPPTGVTTSAGDGQVSIWWNGVPGATSYNIYWSTTAGITKTTGTKIPDVTYTFYNHKDLTNGTTYYYAVTAVNSYGESDISEEKSATPQLFIPPTGWLIQTIDNVS